MAQPTDVSFGTDFNADTFRSAIISVMEMGTPTDDTMKAIFYWDTQYDYSGQVDGSGRPFDLHSAPSSVNAKDPVTALCGVSWMGDSSTGSPLGQFDNPKVELSLLDTEYAKIDGASKLTLGGNWYKIDYVVQSALFTVNTYLIYATAEDET